MVRDKVTVAKVTAIPLGFDEHGRRGFSSLEKRAEYDNEKWYGVDYKLSRAGCK
jgi:hypothetical protein